MKLKFLFSKKNKRNAGVTLLIAILILSTVLAISFSLATILLAEARNSGDLLHTEPALYADNAISEEALYNVSRATGVTTYSSSVGVLPVTSTSTLLNDPVQQVKIPSSNTSYNCGANCYVFYNPTNPYGPGGYGRVQITFLDTGVVGASLHIYLCQWDPLNPPKDSNGNYKNVCSDPTDQSYMSFQDTNPSPLSPGQTWDSAINCGGCMDSTGSKQQQLVLYQTTNGQPANIYAQIATFDSAGNPKGVPYFGQTAVNISSTNAGVNRNIKVVVPNSTVGATPPVALNFDFESGTSGACPDGWTCTGDAMLASTGNGQGCVVAGGISGSQYLKAGCDSTLGTARSQNFTLPVGTDHVRALRAGGADASTGSGWFIKKSSDDSILCSAQNGTDSDVFFTDDCTGLSTFAGTSVYVYVIDNVNSGWGKTYLDNIRVMDAGNNILTP